MDIPDVDAVLDLVGNNEDLFEAILDEYVPDAFSRAIRDDLRTDAVFETRISEPFREHARQRAASMRGFQGPIAGQSGSGPLPWAAPEPEPEPLQISRPDQANRQKGAQIVSGIVNSPLVFPVLLVCFLWYLARQDVLAERQITAGLMQALLHQQTTTISFLRDTAVREAKKEEATRQESLHVNSEKK